MKILVTGGAGYIGSHTVLSLLEAGYDIVVIDNFSNSSPHSLERVEELTSKRIWLCEGDLTNQSFLKEVFLSHPEISAVIHFAAYKAVRESTSQPLAYYRNNVSGSIVLPKV